MGLRHLLTQLLWRRLRFGALISGDIIRSLWQSWSRWRYFVLGSWLFPIYINGVTQIIIFLGWYMLIYTVFAFRLGIATGDRTQNKFKQQLSPCRPSQSTPYVGSGPSADISQWFHPPQKTRQCFHHISTSWREPMVQNVCVFFCGHFTS